MYTSAKGWSVQYLSQHDSGFSNIQRGSDGSCYATCEGATYCSLPGMNWEALVGTPGSLKDGVIMCRSCDLKYYIIITSPLQ